MAARKRSTRASREADRKARAEKRAEAKARHRAADRSETALGFIVKIGVIFAVFFIMYFVLSNCGAKVEKFEIVGNSIVEDADVISLSGISEGGELFRIDTRAAEQQIMMHVMIDDVDVRVRPFDKVLIEVTEKNAVAGFVDGDTYFYIDANKVVVGESDTVDETFPLFSGFDMPEFVSIGLPLTDPALDSDLKIADACKGLFDSYVLEIAAQSRSVNNIYINGIEVRLGSLNRLDEKMQVLSRLIGSMSVQKLESLQYIDVSVVDEPVTMERPLGFEEDEDGEREAAEAEGSAEKPDKKDNKRDTTEAE